MGYGDLGCYGQPYISTLNIDKLAKNGMRFTQAYAGSPVSAPSRASLITGQHTGHCEVLGNKEYWKNIPKVKYLENEDFSVVGQHPYDPDHIILPEIMKDNGYNTGMFGKWAGGYEGSSSTPDKRGVDEFYGFNTITSGYLNGELNIEIPSKRRKGNGKNIILHGASGNNLKDVDVEFPLGKLILVTGVSGSGKSTLVNETLQPILSQHFYNSLKKPMPYKSIEGLENVDKVVTVDQSPLGKTPRSNPATYTGVFSDIRALFVNLLEAKIRGYKPGRFSFNVKGGRCETCGGNGYKTIEMNFLPDVLVPCEACHSKRYNRETLAIRYKGKSIADD